MRITARTAITVPSLCALSLMMADCSSGHSTAATATTTVTHTIASAPVTSTPSMAVTGSSAPPSTSTVSTSTARGVSAARCVAGQLVPTLARTGLAAGSTYDVIGLRNVGHARCSLRGFPGVSMVDGNGHIVGPAAMKATSQAPPLVTVAPGAQTVFDLKVANAANYPANLCGTTPVKGVRIYPPGSRAALFLPMNDLAGCTHPGVALMWLYPVGVHTWA